MPTVKGTSALDGDARNVKLSGRLHGGQECIGIKVFFWFTSEEVTQSDPDELWNYGASKIAVLVMVTFLKKNKILGTRESHSEVRESSPVLVESILYG